MIVLRIASAPLAVALLLAAGCNRGPASQTAQSAEPDRNTQAAANSASSTDSSPETVSNGVRETTFDNIKFEMETTDAFHRQMLTPEVNELFGRRIRIRGYMLPTLKQRGLTEFVLVRDNLECCFGPGAALYDCILVRMEAGKTAEFSIRPIAVAGTFAFQEIVDPVGGRHLAIYGLSAESVE